SRDNSTPRPSVALVSDRSCRSAPSPQPTSSTRAPGSTISAIKRWSTRCAPLIGVCGLSIKDEPMLELEAAFHACRIQESADGGEELGLFQQEGVVSIVGLDLDERDIGGNGVQRVHDLAALARWVEPVARERHDAEACLGAAEGAGQHVAVLGGKVEV